MDNPVYDAVETERLERQSSPRRRTVAAMWSGEAQLSVCHGCNLINVAGWVLQRRSTKHENISVVDKPRCGGALPGRRCWVSAADDGGNGGDVCNFFFSEAVAVKRSRATCQNRPPGTVRHC